MINMYRTLFAVGFLVFGNLTLQADEMSFGEKLIQMEAADQKARKSLFSDDVDKSQLKLQIVEDDKKRINYIKRK